jgi:ABC-type glycerol-3-phosphate transport system substrate-binding protein
MMTRNMVLLASLIGVAAAGLGLTSLMGTSSMADDAKQPTLVHSVYFTLKDGTPENTQKLVDACFKYLKDHPGVVYFAAGPLVPDLARPVNDRDFHVALLVVFKTKKDHDIYQTAPAHLKFIEENKPTWDKVRVFDSYSN